MHTVSLLIRSYVFDANIYRDNFTLIGISLLFKNYVRDTCFHALAFNSFVFYFIIKTIFVMASNDSLYTF